MENEIAKNLREMLSRRAIYLITEAEMLSALVRAANEIGLAMRAENRTCPTPEEAGAMLLIDRHASGMPQSEHDKLRSCILSEHEREYCQSQVGQL